MNTDKVQKSIIIVLEEEPTTDGEVEQRISFSVNGLSDFEVLGLLRLYEQKHSVSLLQSLTQPQNPQP